MFNLYDYHQYSHRHYSQMVQKQLADDPEWTEHQMHTEENTPKQSGKFILVFTTLIALTGMILLAMYLII